MKQIFEEVTLPHLSLKNRLVRSATWEAVAADDGSIDERAYRIYDELAAGGVGAVITGFTSVSDDDRYFEGMLRLSRDGLVPQYRRLSDTVHAHGTPVMAQLALGAYYRAVDSSVIEPVEMTGTGIASDGGFDRLNHRRFVQAEPDEMSDEEILFVESQFADAARRAKEAGFDGVQIHAAHFFFLSRFISPAVNHRTDRYGGSTENRARIVREILAKIRAATPSLHVSVKINSDDFMAGGLCAEESLAICKLLSADGIDSIEVSGNGTSVGGIRAGVNEAYFTPFAAWLAEEVKTPVIVVGGFRSRAKMEEVLEKSAVALISLSRPLLHEPDFPRKLRTGESRVSKCVSCNACYSSDMHRCVFR